MHDFFLMRFNGINFDMSMKRNEEIDVGENC